MAVKLKTPKRATTTLKTTVRKQKAVALKRPPPFTLKITVNIVRILIYTGHWPWNVLYPKYIKEGFLQCHDYGAITHKNAKTLETNFIPLLKRRTKEMIDFSSLSKCYTFYSFCHCFSVKFLKRYLAHVWFYWRHLLLNKSRVSIDPFLLFCASKSLLSHCSPLLPKFPNGYSTSHFNEKNYSLTFDFENLENTGFYF